MKSKLQVNFSAPLEPLVKFCQANRGAKSRVQAEMRKRGHKASWSMVSGWLHPVTFKRKVPDLITGIALIRVGETIMNKKGNEQ